MQLATVGACCQLEARAFNALRRVWGQPEQPERRPECLTAYMNQYPQGAMVARDGERVVGFCISHRWGSLGWIGPIAVESDRQRSGVGRALTEPVMNALRADGCTTVALETWPHHLPNIKFYLRLGFASMGPVFILEKPIGAITGRLPRVRLSQLPNPRPALDGLRRLSQSVSSGLDYGPAAEVALGCGLGDVILWDEPGSPWAAALVHTASQLQAPPPSWLEVFLLVVRPGHEHRLEECLAELQAYAASLGRNAIRLAVCSCHPDGLLRLVRELGFKVAKTRLRMALQHVPVVPDTIDYVSFGI